MEHNETGAGWPLIASETAGGSAGEGGGVYFDDYNGDIYVEGSLVRYNVTGSGGTQRPQPGARVGMVLGSGGGSTL